MSSCFSGAAHGQNTKQDHKRHRGRQIDRQPAQPLTGRAARGEGVRIVSISPAMASPDNPNENHMETVEMRYEKITWKHCDGNIICTDSWNDRVTA